MKAVAAATKAEGRCPICGKAVGALAVNRAHPFCSPRCRQVDLGKWLNEEYRVPAEQQDDDAAAGGDGHDGGPGEGAGGAP